MAAQLEDILQEAKRALVDPEFIDLLLQDLPDVDPESDDLDDLRKWGRAVMEAGRLTPESLDALVAFTKRHAHRNRYQRHR